MNSIDISKDSKEYQILNTYLGQGRPDASLVFFGNEPGTAALGVEDTIKYLEKAERINIFGRKLEEVEKSDNLGYFIETSYSKPTTSEFVRFISRLTLAIKHKDPRFLGELTSKGTVAINEHICKPNSEKDICLVNLRPLPRPTQDTWEYPNINRKEYNKSFNYTLKRHRSDYIDCFRVDSLHKFFRKTNAVIIGVGEKNNKRAFFEKQYPFPEFHTAELDTIKVFFNIEHKIVLADYFNSRNGIKLQGLQELYNFLLSRKLV